MCDCQSRHLLLVLWGWYLFAVNKLLSFQQGLHVVDDKRLEVDNKEYVKKEQVEKERRKKKTTQGKKKQRPLLMGILRT